MAIIVLEKRIYWQCFYWPNILLTNWIKTIIFFVLIDVLAIFISVKGYVEVFYPIFSDHYSSPLHYSFLKTNLIF